MSSHLVPGPLLRLVFYYKHRFVNDDDWPSNDFGNYHMVGNDKFCGKSGTLPEIGSERGLATASVNSIRVVPNYWFSSDHGLGANKSPVQCRNLSPEFARRRCKYHLYNCTCGGMEFSKSISASGMFLEKNFHRK